MIYAENHDLSHIVTLIDVNCLTRLLKQSKYPMEKVMFLEQGFRHGFNVGYRGPKIRQSCAQNIPLKVGSKVQLSNKIMKEVQLGQVVGPFDTIPFDNFIQSQIGLVPKSGSDGTRLIFHLSYDFDNTAEGRSLNFHTLEEICSVKYNDLDEAVRSCLRIKAMQNDATGQKDSLIYSTKVIVPYS